MEKLQAKPPQVGQRAEANSAREEDVVVGCVCWKDDAACSLTLRLFRRAPCKGFSPLVPLLALPPPSLPSPTSSASFTLWSLADASDLCQRDVDGLELSLHGPQRLSHSKLQATSWRPPLFPPPHRRLRLGHRHSAHLLSGILSLRSLPSSPSQQHHHHYRSASISWAQLTRCLVRLLFQGVRGGSRLARISLLLRCSSVGLPDFCSSFSSSLPGIR